MSSCRPTVLAAGTTGLAVALGLILISVAPGWVGWPLAALAVTAAYIAAVRFERTAPRAGAARPRARGSFWLGLLVLLSAGLWLTYVPSGGRVAVIALAAVAVVVAGLDRRLDRFGGGLIAATTGFGALFLGLYPLMAAIEPAMVIAAIAGLQSALLARDQLPPAAHRRSILTVVAALIAAQTTLLLAFVPVAPWAEAGLALIVVYCTVGLMTRSVESGVSRRSALEYALVLLGGVISVGVLGR